MRSLAGRRLVSGANRAFAARTIDAASSIRPTLQEWHNGFRRRSAPRGGGIATLFCALRFDHAETTSDGAALVFVIIVFFILYVIELGL